jgi:hypothetical protein
MTGPPADAGARRRANAGGWRELAIVCPWRRRSRVAGQPGDDRGASGDEPARCRTRRQQQPAAGERQILEEHRALDVIGEIQVEQHRRRQAKARQQECRRPREPSREQRRAGADLKNDDKRRQRAGHMMLGAMRQRSLAAGDLADAGEDEQQGDEGPAAGERRCV